MMHINLTVPGSTNRLHVFAERVEAYEAHFVADLATQFTEIVPLTAGLATASHIGHATRVNARRLKLGATTWPVAKTCRVT
jgi:hypothetical protein